jgi:hypothetical protein
MLTKTTRDSEVAGALDEGEKAQVNFDEMAAVGADHVRGDWSRSYCNDVLVSCDCHVHPYTLEGQALRKRVGVSGMDRLQLNSMCYEGKLYHWVVHL